jgi:hypothetical protein
MGGRARYGWILEMWSMEKEATGIIDGKTIQLREDLGMGSGQPVRVSVEPLTTPETWGEGIRRSAGALADSWSEEDDRILDALRRERHHDARPEPAE